MFHVKQVHYKIFSDILFIFIYIFFLIFHVKYLCLISNIKKFICNFGE